MDDVELVAAIAAHDPHGLTETYDKHAPAIYAYCHSVLRDPAQAASAVEDTFVVAWSRLDGLTEPTRLSQWLHAVAKVECDLRLRAAALAARGPEKAYGANQARRAEKTRGPGPARGPEETAEAASAEAASAEAASAEATSSGTPPPRLREHIVALCTDETPAGRAYRVSVTHRAGSFRKNGFPRRVSAARPQRNGAVLSSRQLAAGLAATTAVIIVAVVAIVMVLGSPHPAKAAAESAVTPPFAGSAGASPGATRVPGNASARLAPPASASLSATKSGAGHPAPGARPSSPAASGSAQPPDQYPTPAPSQSSQPPIQTQPPGPPPPSPMTEPPTTPAPPKTSPPPSPKPTPKPSAPAPGTLKLESTGLILTSIGGKPITGSLTFSAVGGPVTYHAAQSGGTKLTISPASGTIPAGKSVTVAITGAGTTVAYSETITVTPGNLTIKVLVQPPKS